MSAFARIGNVELLSGATPEQMRAIFSIIGIGAAAAPAAAAPRKAAALKRARGVEKEEDEEEAKKEEEEKEKAAGRRRAPKRGRSAPPAAYVEMSDSEVESSSTESEAEEETPRVRAFWQDDRHIIVKWRDEFWVYIRPFLKSRLGKPPGVPVKRFHITFRNAARTGLKYEVRSFISEESVRRLARGSHAWAQPGSINAAIAAIERARIEGGDDWVNRSNVSEDESSDDSDDGASEARPRARKAGVTYVARDNVLKRITLGADNAYYMKHDDDVWVTPRKALSYQSGNLADHIQYPLTKFRLEGVNTAMAMVKGAVFRKVIESGHILSGYADEMLKELDQIEAAVAADKVKEGAAAIRAPLDM